MSKEILKCKKCDEYTISLTCPKCNEKVISTKPAKFSPEDKFGYWRRVAKKEVKKDVEDKAFLESKT